MGITALLFLLFRSSCQAVSPCTLSGRESLKPLILPSRWLPSGSQSLYPVWTGSTQTITYGLNRPSYTVKRVFVRQVGLESISCPLLPEMPRPDHRGHPTTYGTRQKLQEATPTPSPQCYQQDPEENADPRCTRGGGEGGCCGERKESQDKYQVSAFPPNLTS